MKFPGLQELSNCCVSALGNWRCTRFSTRKSKTLLEFEPPSPADASADPRLGARRARVRAGVGELRRRLHGPADSLPHDVERRHLSGRLPRALVPPVRAHEHGHRVQNVRCRGSGIVTVLSFEIAIAYTAVRYSP